MTEFRPRAASPVVTGVQSSLAYQADPHVRNLRPKYLDNSPCPVIRFFKILDAQDQGDALRGENQKGIAIPGAGELLWNGLHIDNPNTFLVPPHYAYIPQASRLVSYAIRNNIFWDADLSERQIANAIHDSAMEYDISQMNDALETVVGPRGVRLSGGQVQRTATAWALVHNTDFVVVDELSSALDVETELAFGEHISKRL
jgi:hypothetical protein